jgi:hypothetical protein
MLVERHEFRAAEDDGTEMRYGRVFGVVGAVALEGCAVIDCLGGDDAGFAGDG